jgi:transcriptional regulator with XRE-family HTH domain
MVRINRRMWRLSMEPFGEQVRGLLRERRIRQKEFASRINMSLSGLTMMLSGRTNLRPERLDTLLDALEATDDERRALRIAYLLAISPEAVRREARAVVRAFEFMEARRQLVTSLLTMEDALSALPDPASLGFGKAVFGSMFDLFLKANALPADEHARYVDALESLSSPGRFAWTTARLVPCLERLNPDDCDEADMGSVTKHMEDFEILLDVARRTYEETRASVAEGPDSQPRERKAAGAGRKSRKKGTAGSKKPGRR